jgi:hypothetical protein
MVRVSIEIRNGAARCGVAVQAENIRRALSIAGNRYPGSDVEVAFPIDPEGFFIKDPTAIEGPVESEQRERIAA